MNSIYSEEIGVIKLTGYKKPTFQSYVTRNDLLEFFKKNSEKKYTCSQITIKFGISVVDIRIWLNQMLGKGEIQSNVEGKNRKYYLAREKIEVEVKNNFKPLSLNYNKEAFDRARIGRSEDFSFITHSGKIYNPS
jgi:hypothetical protein